MLLKQIQGYESIYPNSVIQDSQLGQQCYPTLIAWLMTTREAP